MKIAQKYQGRGKQYPIDNLFDVKSNWYWNDIKDGYINTCEGCDKGRRATSCLPLSLQVGLAKNYLYRWVAKNSTGGLEIQLDKIR